MNRSQWTLRSRQLEKRIHDCSCEANPFKSIWPRDSTYEQPFVAGSAQRVLVLLVIELLCVPAGIVGGALDRRSNGQRQGRGVPSVGRSLARLWAFYTDFELVHLFGFAVDG